LVVNLLLLAFEVLLLLVELIFSGGDLSLFFLHMLNISLQGPFSESNTNIWKVEKILNIGSRLLLGLEHPSDHSHELLAVLLRDPVKDPISDLESQRQMVVGLEWRRQIGHLIDDDPKGPDIALLIIPLLIALLRAHVKRTANIGLGEVCLSTH
jgi:hypothetical protein